MYFAVNGQPHVISPDELAMIYENWELVTILSGCNIFIFELDMQLNHSILFIELNIIYQQ